MASGFTSTAFTILLASLQALYVFTAESPYPHYKLLTIEHKGFAERGKNGRPVGFIPDLLKEMASVGNFTYEFTWHREDLKWNDMITSLEKGEVDVVSAALTMSSVREKKIDFSVEIMDDGLSLIMLAPKPEPDFPRSAAFFLAPFSTGVWVSALLIWLASSFFIFLNAKLNPRESPKEQGPVRLATVTTGALLTDTRDFSLMGSLFYTVSTACFQGYNRPPRSIAGRLLSVIWWVFVGIFGATYVAGFFCCLVASKGSEQRAYPYLTFRDVYNARGDSSLTGLWPVWPRGGNVDDLMYRSRSPIFKFLRRLHEEVAPVNSNVTATRTPDDVIRLIKTDSRFMGVMESSMADYYARTSGCKFIVAGQLISDRSYAFAFNHNENKTLRDNINSAILQLREEGTVAELYAAHFGGIYQNAATCNYKAAGNIDQQVSVVAMELAHVFRDSLPITVATFVGPILFYVFGLILTLAGIGADVFVYTRYERYKQAGPTFSNLQESAEPSFGTLTFSDEQNLTEQS